MSLVCLFSAAVFALVPGLSGRLRAVGTASLSICALMLALP